MRKPRTPKKKYLIHATSPDGRKPFHEGESNKTKAFRILNDVLCHAPIGSVGAVYLRTRDFDLPIDNVDPGSPYVQRVGCYRYRDESGVTKLPHRKGKP